MRPSGSRRWCGASVAPGDPAPPCGGLSSGKSDWYEYTPPADGTVTVDSLGSGYDTVLSAWTGPCGMLAAVPGGCNDDYPPGATSVLQIPVSGGVTYRFMVSAYYDDGGVTAFHLNFDANPPANDGCDGANVVSGYPYQDAAYTAAASVEAGEPPRPAATAARRGRSGTASPPRPPAN